MSNHRRRLRDIFTLKTTEGRLKFLILIVGVFILLGVITFSSFQVTRLPGFCTLCHEMNPEYVTWKASVHSDFSCAECHSSTGLKNISTEKVNFISKLYKHFSGTYVEPIELKKDISNNTCLKCHSINRQVSPPEGLVFPHKRHVDKGFNCVTCHNNVAHGGVKERGYTINTDFAKWTTGMGKAYMKKNFIILDMQSCIDCHTERGKPTSCTTCHTGSINLPENHLKEKWQNGLHGQEALRNIQQCNKCHSYSNSYLVKPAPGVVAQYTRNNEFCSKCHLKKPVGHGQDWRQVHKNQATASKQGCLVCHQENKPGKNTDQVTTTYCIKCHREKPHLNIENRHPFSLQGKQLGKGCMTCHPVNVCNKCHYIN